MAIKIGNNFLDFFNEGIRRNIYLKIQKAIQTDNKWSLIHFLSVNAGGLDFYIKFLSIYRSHVYSKMIT